MPESPRVVASGPARSLDGVLDAAASRLSVVTPEADAVHGEPWLDSIPDGERYAAHEALARVAHGESPVHVDLGVVCWTLTALSDTDGQVVHVLASGIDAAERDRIESDLRELT